MWWLQTPASTQEIPLCSTPGEDRGPRKKAPHHLLARRERKVSRPQAGPKWNLRSRSWEAIWGSAWVARPFLPLALGRAKFRRVLPLSLQGYWLTASLISACPFPPSRLQAAQLRGRAVSLAVGRGPPRVSPVSRGSAANWIVKDDPSAQLSASWAPATRGKLNADSGVGLPAKALCQAQTPEGREDGGTEMGEEQRQGGTSPSAPIGR